MRLHVLSLPHTHTTHKYVSCAFTQNLVKFSKMMTQRGHEVVVYSGEHNDAVCAEHVPLFSEAERKRWYGSWKANSMFSNVDWAPDKKPWTTMNKRAIKEIKRRAEPRDVLCLTQGWSQQTVADAFRPTLTLVEYTAGYEGTHVEHCVYPSYAWMHFLYGKRRGKSGSHVDGNPYDIVIPHYFDPEDFFDVSDPERPERGDHLLFVGRLVARKWPRVAAEIAERTGRELLVAGPGVVRHKSGRIVVEDTIIEGPVRYIGALTLAERKTEMARAAAVIMPTQYIEPFGMVAVEAMMSGTPVVATDWGAFPETVIPGKSGYRFRTLAEGAHALERAVRLDPARVQRHARANYSFDVIGRKYTDYFKVLDTLWTTGWYT